MPKPILAILITLAMTFGPGATALADEFGTEATVTGETALVTGPGARYPSAGVTLAEGEAVTITRCSNRWCLIEGTNGWMSTDQLEFGNYPDSVYRDVARGGPGEICFHQGRNFSGTTVCLPSGAVARDLQLLGWDDKVSSISVNGNVSVNVCRDREFKSYCELVYESQPQLGRLLENSVSSWQVW